MLYINNCKNGIVASHAEVRVVASAFFTGVRDLAIGINHGSYLESVAGAPGATVGIYITDCKRGISVGNVSNANVSNGWIFATSHGVAAFNAFSLRFDNGSIIGIGTGSTTQPASVVGAYLDNSNASFFNTSVTGFTGGTGGTASAHYQCINFSVLHHGSTAETNKTSMVTRHGNTSTSTIVIGGTAANNPEIVIDEPRINLFNV